MTWPNDSAISSRMSRTPFRTLRQNPAFAGIVILILALGIGPTPPRQLIDALMLAAPVSHPEALVTIGDPRATGRLSEGTPESDIASYPLYTDLRDGNHVLTDCTRAPDGRLDVVIDQTPSLRTARAHRSGASHGRFVTGNFFSVLAVGAVAGRTFADTKDPLTGARSRRRDQRCYCRKRFGR